MTRRRDWPERLVEALDRIALEPTELGRSDCFTLFQDVVEALTGTRPFADEAGRYRTPRGAARRLRANGFADLAALLAATGRELPPAFAGRGDLGLAPGADGTPAIVVCDGATWLGRSDGRGLVRRPRSIVARAYRID